MLQIQSLGHIIVDDVRFNLARHISGELKFQTGTSKEWRDYRYMPENVQRNAEKQGHRLMCDATAKKYAAFKATANQQIQALRGSTKVHAYEGYQPPSRLRVQELAEVV